MVCFLCLHNFNQTTFSIYCYVCYVHVKSIPTKDPSSFLSNNPYFLVDYNCMAYSNSPRLNCVYHFIKAGHIPHVI